MKVRISSVYDDGALVSTNLIGSKGLSILVDVDERSILFNTGHNPRYLIHNLKNMDRGIESIDSVVISKGDKFVAGGFGGLIEEREQPLKLYVSTGCTGYRTILGRRSLGDFKENDLITVEEVDDWTQVTESSWVSPPLVDESFMVIKTSKGLVLLIATLSCDIESILNAVKDRFGVYPFACFGGIAMGRKGRNAPEVGRALTASGISDVYLNSFTGQVGMTQMRAILGLNNVKDFYVGSMVDY